MSNNGQPQPWAILPAAKLLVISGLGWLVSASMAAAQVTTSYTDLILGDRSPIELAILIINWAMGILALIAVIIILWGGFVWLLSRGEEEKVNKAKAILRNGLIGLVIILAAWGIATYILNQLLDITGAKDVEEKTPCDDTTQDCGDGGDAIFYIDHTNPKDKETDVPLCHLIAATFSFPVTQQSVTDSSFKVTLPYDAASNPDGGKAAGESCTEGVQCKSGVCTSEKCVGNQLPGSFDFSENVSDTTTAMSYSAVFYPAVDYFPDETYQVELTTAIVGVDPNIGATYNLRTTDPKRNFTFTTGNTTDEIPPKVDVTQVTPYPTDGGADICLNPSLQVTFSESLDPASPGDENFWLYPITDTNSDGEADNPTDALPIDWIRLNSLGGEADDTIVTRPEQQLEKITEYGINLYSGGSTIDPATNAPTFADAIFDTCGNPLSGNFDDAVTGSPTDDFVDPTSAGIGEAFCTCVSDSDTCTVAAGKQTCSLASGGTCDLGNTCDASDDNYVGFDYQWTWITGEQVECKPLIDTVSQADRYYSEDKADSSGTTGATGPEDSGLVLITGSNLYPFIDVYFNNNIGTAGQNCFDTSFAPTMSCFVDHINDTLIRLRTPVASQTGRLTIENADGVDTSADVAVIDSPYLRSLSPGSGPAGQYVTLRGENFVDYDPAIITSQRGSVYFDDVKAEVMCDDGWDNEEIIVRVPDEFAVGATPNIQIKAVGPDLAVDTTDDKHSNLRAFTITDGEPGPGLCELQPSCSDTGQDDITAVGENFGDDVGGAVYFDPSTGPYITGTVKNWNLFNATYDSYTVVTNKTPVTVPDEYEFTVANTIGISNGLDFNITCSEPPEVFASYQCDLDNTFYLPNPRNYSNNACVNSVVYFAFNQNMNDSSVNANVKVYRCNTGEEFDVSSCDLNNPIAGSWVNDYLNDAYIGGTGALTLNGTTDIDGDGDTDVNDAYSAYTFYPDAPLSPNTQYYAVIPVTVTNDNNVPLSAPYDWHWQVRNDAANCVVDALALYPGNQISNSYEAADACLDNYSVDTSSYTFRSVAANSECIVLDDAGNYNWSIANPSTGSVLGFGDNSSSVDTVTAATTDTTTNGYNTVCLQGEQEGNQGDATVTADILDPNNLSSVTASDSAIVTVDYGYCTDDSDCFTEDCRDTFCDPETSHCAPDITGFTPNKRADVDASNDASADVGPGGCVTIAGCYFGSSQQQNSFCTCTSLKQPSETCTINEGSSSCLLDDRSTTCTLGEATCTLSDTCSTASSEADYSLGFFRGCNCTILTTSQTCTVSEGATTCVADGAETCAVDSTGFTAGSTGSVTFANNAIAYPNAELCGDTWDNEQVIVQVPNTGSLIAGNYSINLNSYYGQSDTYGTAAGDQYDCVVGTDPTPCLCLADPDSGQEGDETDLYGEGFNLLVTDGDEKVTFSGATDRKTADGSESWVQGVCTTDRSLITRAGCLAAGETWDPLATAATDAVVPGGSVSATDGVQLESTNLTSNALEFNVSCSSDYDCATGCCSAGQCAAAEVCNACVNDTDCSKGSCQSACVDGICAPYITSLSPEVGAEGQPVTIQGCYFGSYYNPVRYNPGSQVTADGIVAALACSETDAWSNQEIIVTLPDGIFKDEADTAANIQVQQAYKSSSVQTSQLSNEVVFTKDNSCSEVDIPVLCNTNPAYGPLGETVTLTGDNFYNQNDGYCACQLATLGDCKIPEGSTSCTVTQTSTFYVNPDDQTETCTIGTTNFYTTYDSGAASGAGACVYNNSGNTCEIAIGSASCTVPVSETCYVDEIITSTTCNAAVDGFISLDGSVEYFENLGAEIDWDNYVADTQYVTTVPDGASTGDVQAIATTSNGRQCGSNGLEFPVSCNSCGDCASADGNLNCDLGFDTAFGACTAETTGYCRANPSSCCNYSSCVYDSAAATTTDAGTCASQPLLLLDDSDGDSISDALESVAGTNPSDSDSDDDGTLDNADHGLSGVGTVSTGRVAGEIITADTNPEPSDQSICPNSQIVLEFDQAVIPSTAFPFNNNELTDAELEAGIDPTADDIPVEAIDYKPSIRLRPASFSDTSTDSVIADIIPNSSQTSLTLELSSMLKYGTQYEIIIDTNDTIASGTAYQSGLVSLADGAALGCTSDQAALGLCGDGYLKYEFGTLNPVDMQTRCSPRYVRLEADNDDFADANYIFTEAEQEEPFIATVYSAGNDELVDIGITDADGDDQVIQRIDDGAEAGYWWTYDWETIYASLEDLENGSCPVAGIITDNDSAFIVDQEKQTVTADSPEEGEDNTDSVKVTVTGDGSVEDGWGRPSVTTDDLVDSQAVSVQYCASDDYLVSFANSDYNFDWSYCRGSDPSDDSFLPEFDVIFERSITSDPSISDIYGDDTDFIYEVALKDEQALVNDPSTNNNTIALRVYPNNLDNNEDTIGDSVNPALWYLLNTSDSDSGYTETTVDDYQAITVGNTTYVAISNLDDDSDKIKPYIFVLAYSNEANEVTIDIVDQIITNLRFNSNADLATACGLEKSKMIKDTKRVNDLGTLAYLLTSYYYNDSDGNGVNDLPALEAGSYISGVSTSIWPSWNDTFGAALGQELATDPVNSYFNAASSCLYDPPDVEAGETTGTYYDESGTCWDPVLNDYYGPPGSYLYQYNYGAADAFSLYTNLEYTGSGSWVTGSYNPCTAVNEFSSRGCNTFNYSIGDANTIDNTNYSANFGSSAATT